jgi:hypothetical protein
MTTIMRNRTPTAVPVGKIQSPIQRKSSDKSLHRHHTSSCFPVRAMLIAFCLGLVGVYFYAKSGTHNDMPAGTISPKMRKGDQQQVLADMLVDEKKKPNVQIGKDGKLIVHDSDGDLVTDDVVAKDIANGNLVDKPEVEDVEADVVDGENRWQHSQTIPDWLKEYFEWHRQVTRTITEENWQKEHNYLVMTCLGGQTCGNVAHRLRPIMGMLRMAADTKRILYIHWDMPDRLEKYLHPPKRGGIDWIIPQFIIWKVRKTPHLSEINAIRNLAYQQDRRVINVMFNDDTFAEPYYNDRRKDGEKAASEALKDTWGVLFRPSFLLTERTTESLRLMGLQPGEYATAHIDYEAQPKDDAEQEELRLKVEHAMNCMSQLRPGGPFLVAAQTYAIAREAIVYGKQHNVVVHSKQIAHDTSTVPKDLVLSFVEIMLMINSRCVAYNRGGYGQLGYLLGYNYNCRIKYSDTQDCKWTDPLPASEEREKAEREEVVPEEEEKSQ